MTQILNFYYVSGDLVSGGTAVTVMDTVSTFMEHSVQGGKINAKLMSRCKIRQDNMIESN